MKILGNNKSKINEKKNGKNVSHLEITELVLTHLILLTKIISKI